LTARIQPKQKTPERAFENRYLQLSFVVTFIRESYKRIPVVETEGVVALVHREIDDVLKTLPPFSLVTNVKWQLVEFEKKMKKAEEEASAVRPTTSHGTKRGLASDFEIYEYPDYIRPKPVSRDGKP
jgi:hypothetical protein